MFRLFLFCAFAGSLLAQPSGNGMLIEPSPGGKAKNAREADVLDRMVNRLADLIQDAIPCARLSTMEDVKQALGEARDQEMLGNTPNADLSKVLEKINVREVVTVDVTEIGGQMYVTLVYYDMRTARAVDRDGASIPGDDASIDSFAEKFASKIKAQSPSGKSGNCPADKSWYGSITATVNKSVDRKSQRNRCEETEKGTEAWRYTVRIPRRGKATAYAQHRRLQTRHSTCKRQVMCGQTVGDEISENEQTDQVVGAGNVPASVDITESGGKLFVSVSMENLTVERTLDGFSEYKGACTKNDGPKQHSVPPVKMPIPVSGFLVPAQAVQPGQKLVKGSGGDKEATVSWRLVRAPSSK